ncbi:MAG: DUF1794 domain-containing protein [Actinomycetales bacterium]|nr:DUF1794 domain-containing protein [Actinomycetales bacterium]
MTQSLFPPQYLEDVFTEPDASPDTAAHLGPLAPLIGVWEGVAGVDTHPQADGPETEKYVERWTFEPTDPQTNGPQLLYGLRYHQHVHKPAEVETFHDQVGYLLWEPATERVVMTLAIPRAQVAMAGGLAAADARVFTLRAEVGDAAFGIVTGPFLDAAFHTTSWEITFRILDDGFAYLQTTMLEVHGQPEPFAHTDANRLTRVCDVPPNPLAGGPSVP